MADDQLQPRSVPRPVTGPGALSRDQLPGDGRPPLSRGKVHMTDHTRQQLEHIGWKPGMPIPGDLGQRLQQIQRELNEEREQVKLEDTELAKGWKPVEAKFVSIESLPLEKQEELRQYLQEYAAEKAREAAFEANVAEVDAAIPENIQGPQRDLMREQIVNSEAAMAARRAGRSDSVVIDDRQAAVTPPPDMQLPEGKTYGGSLGQPSVAAKIEEANRLQREHEKAQAAQPAPPAAELPSSGVPHTHTNCQRCTWPLDMPFEIVPTIEDKQGFLAAVLGLSRFEKRYSLLNGNLEVTFRSLSSDETALVQNQLGAMVRSGASRGDGEYWGNLHEFRMVLSVRRITVGGNSIYDVPPIAEWMAANPPTSANVEPTQIPQLRDHFYAKGATQEPVRRIIGQTFQKFQRLVEALEFMTDNPDFWNGIELHA